MTDIAALVADNLDIWASAIERKSGAGRGGGGKRISLYGIERLRALIFDLAAAGKLIAGSNVQAEKLGKHVDLVMGQAPPGNACNTDGDGTIFVKTGEFGPRYPEIREWTTKPLKLAKSGDVLICVVGATIGKLNLAIDCAIGRSVAAIRPKPSLDTNYLYYALMPFTLRLRVGARGSAQGVIGKAELNAVSIRVPPLAEQHRIVAKVDELMALCDALERESADAMAAHQTLVETLLSTLVNSADAADLVANWARLETHFDTLFTTDASIEALKQTILDLAVRGKLAEQDREDGSATDLLSQIEKQKRELVSDGQIKKSKALEAIDPARAPFPIPANWAWRRLGDVAFLVTDGEHLTPKRIDDPNGVPLVTAKNVRAGAMDYSVTDFVSRETAEVCWRRCRPEKNDILLVSVGATIGRHTIVNDFREMVIVRSVTLIKADHALVPYLSCVIGSEMMQRQIWGGVRQSAQPCLYLNVSNALQIPIPPLAEQHRIVAKVDELMAICDDLKERLADATETRRNLADVIVERAAA